MTAPASHRGPVFVGGTGRSGTTIVGELIGGSEAYALIPIEIRFHIDPGGLSDLARGRVSVTEFKDAMLSKWYVRKPNSSGPRGVHVIMDKPDLERALERLHNACRDDPWRGAGQFLRDVLDPVAERADKSSWVEMSPPTAQRMDDLARMLPDAQFVHMVRDGRDVASSVVRRPWGPDDFPTALRWWADELIAIDRAVSNTDLGRVLTMRLESLSGQSRGDAYRRLTDFLALTGDMPMRAFLDSEVTAAKARFDRWRIGLDDAGQREFQALYDTQLQRLKEAGVTLPDIA